MGRFTAFTGVSACVSIMCSLRFCLFLSLPDQLYKLPGWEPRAVYEGKRGEKKGDVRYSRRLSTHYLLVY